MSLRQKLRNLSTRAAIVIALVLVAMTGWADYLTGWEWSLFIFYALPIVLVVWNTDEKIGYFFAVLCGVTWWAAQIESNPYRTVFGFSLAVATRQFYFFVLVVAVTAVKSRRELDQERIETLERARELENEILRTSEQEQQRIGRDLHDGLGPHLAAIGYAASFLADELRQNGKADAAKAEQIYEMAQEAISLTRDLARGIFPVQMDGTGLSVALEELARTASRLTGVSISYSDATEGSSVAPEDAMHLYRIAQEAVNNAVKHGDASNIAIVLSRADGSMRLLIADDGKGMPESPHDSRGIGLHSMSYRARTLGGKIDISSNPGEGTSVSCEIPIPHPHTAIAAS
jgi:signal transduction histidine kinase